MKTNLKYKLLVGTAAVALFAAASARDAAAQYVSGGQPPGTVSGSVEGGYAIGTSTNNTTWGEADSYTSVCRGEGEDKRCHDVFAGASPLNVGGGDGFVGRVALGWQYDPQWSFGIMYTGLRSSQSSSQSGDMNTVMGGGKHGGYPQFGFNGDVSTRISADIVDFQAGYDFGLGSGGIATALVGLEYGHFRQKTDVGMTQGGCYGYDDEWCRYNGAGTDRASTYNGGGPTLGIKGQMPFSGDVRHGFGVVGQAQGGLLFGHLDSETTAVGICDPMGREVSRDRMAETVQGQLALTYAMPVGAASSVQLALGYQVMYFAGVRDSQNGTSSLDPPVYGSTSDNLLYHGPFARLTVNFGVAAAPPPPPPPAPPAAAAPAPKREERKFLVFFDFDKSTLTPDGAKIVQNTAATFKATGAAHLDLTGYTDLSGTKAYNLKLSERRAETVRNYLVQLGVPPSDIGVYWRGKENPRVPTPDGVREPQNRRVEIVMP